MTAVVCDLCPRHCRLPEGGLGLCRVRTVREGRVQPLGYGQACAVQVDPIEKKPLHHCLPGTRILSVAAAGCNLRCRNCQNAHIAQQDPESVPSRRLPPAEVVGLALGENCPSVAFTYTDPVVHYEYARDIGAAVRKAGLRSVLVTAAYVNPAPWRELCRVSDAANIDLKALSDDFYRSVCSATLQPVLAALVTAKELGVWVEVTHLVIPTLNDGDDDLRRLAAWVGANLGRDTPLHVSRFFPRHQALELPPTPVATLRRAAEIATAEGLQHVYLGNVDGWTDTCCPGCRRLLIRRLGYRLERCDLEDGRCPGCRRPLAGIWPASGAKDPV